jgi:hypothetical protein
LGVDTIKDLPARGYALCVLLADVLVSISLIISCHIRYVKLSI